MVTIYQQFGNKKFCIPTTQYIYAFCSDVRITIDCCRTRNYLVSFYNPDGVCLLCGTL